MDEATLRGHALVRDLVVAVFRANGAIIANGDRMVADLELSSSLWQVLDALDRSPGELTVADIARAMGLTRQSVQRSTDLLAARGLVAYRDNPAHKRAQLVVMTPAGRAALDAVQVREVTSIAQVLARLEPEQITRATDLLAAFAGELVRQTHARGTP